MVILRKFRTCRYVENSPP